MKFVRSFTLTVSLLGLISITNECHSQEVFSFFDFDYGSLFSSGPKQVRAISKNGYHYFYFSANSKKYFTLVSPSGELVKQITKPNQLSKKKPLGTIFHNGSFHTFFFKNKSKSILTIYSMDTAGRLVIGEKNLDVKKPEKFIGIANDRNQLFFIYATKKENRITTHHFRGVDNISRDDYSLDQGSSPFPILSANGGFQAILPSQKTDLLTSKPLKKAYIENGIVYLIIENSLEDYKQSSSHIFKLDPASDKYTYTALRSQLTATNQQSNSLLFDNRVFKITLVSDALELTVFSLKNWAIEKRFNYSRQDEELEIMQGELYREGTPNKMGSFYKTFDKVPAILRQLTIGMPAISVSMLKQNEYAIRIGAVGESNQNQLGQSNKMAQNTHTYQDQYGNFYSYNYYESARHRRYFNSYLDRQDLSITETNTDHLSIYQTIMSFYDRYDQRGKSFMARAIYTDEKDNYYTSFFDLVKSKFVILSF